METNTKLAGEDNRISVKAVLVTVSVAFIVFISTFMVPNTWYTSPRHLLPLMFIALIFSCIVAYINDGFIISISIPFILLAATTNELVSLPPNFGIWEYVVGSVRIGIVPGIPIGIVGYISGRALLFIKRRL